ncbi:hypothetical protein TREMEDRAFT_64770 [Tremella mesenterica DSM 1558]|uniref:uncharacterized protein n=1 Tax=Tremella mesenterica (strain ATCC 24925 / CBS 8224 / DSM 1558 / NBRC 9311 / NRRL Y-6157 / RJB 2259-6 / UBC 559-6) TaxID=578456 RepID=UPI0003F4911D|nr:uncharacterized protein TREMEDRAFT_64770 [Tremella mesenterica DSM 1558]EIW66916.1 hypothetical protein TREMEDRAFT_64770 [Tremella mesenterica DSM 1558]
MMLLNQWSSSTRKGIRPPPYISCEYHPRPFPPCSPPPDYWPPLTPDLTFTSTLPLVPAPPAPDPPAAPAYAPAPQSGKPGSVFETSLDPAEYLISWTNNISDSKKTSIHSPVPKRDIASHLFLLNEYTTPTTVEITSHSLPVSGYNSTEVILIAGTPPEPEPEPEPEPGPDRAPSRSPAPSPDSTSKNTLPHGSDDDFCIHGVPVGATTPNDSPPAYPSPPPSPPLLKDPRPLPTQTKETIHSLLCRSRHPDLEPMGEYDFQDVDINVEAFVVPGIVRLSGTPKPEPTYPIATPPPRPQTRAVKGDMARNRDRRMMLSRSRNDGNEWDMILITSKGSEPQPNPQPSPKPNTPPPPTPYLKPTPGPPSPPPIPDIENPNLLILTIVGSDNFEHTTKSKIHQVLTYEGQESTVDKTV